MKTITTEDKMATQKTFNATANGQKAMCQMAGRLAVLHSLNEAIRKMDANESYDRLIIDSLSSDNAMSEMLEMLRQDYNRLISNVNRA